MIPSPRYIEGKPVGSVGFGAMRLSFGDRPDTDQSIRLIRLAVEEGVRLVDTAPSYCATATERGHNERLIATALSGLPGRDEVVIATKAGQLRSHSKGFVIDARPTSLRASCEQSLRDLNAEYLDLCHLHWPDPKVPYADSVGALKDLQVEGKIRWIGVSNVSLQHLRTAQRIVRVTSVQNRFSDAFGPGRITLEVCSSEKIAFLAYGVLGGRQGPSSIASAIPAVADMAKSYGISVPRLLTAWAINESDALLPVVGARVPEHLRDSLLGAVQEIRRDNLMVLQQSYLSKLEPSEEKLAVDRR